MSATVNKLTGRPYNGETAKDVDFDTFLQGLSLEEIELQTIRADKLGYGEYFEVVIEGDKRVSRRLENVPSYEIHTTAWWEQAGDADDGAAYNHSEVYVTVNTSILVKHSSATEMARIEARYEVCYYSWLPMDDETFVTFSETRVMDDLWPEIRLLVNDILGRFELNDFVMTDPSITGIDHQDVPADS